MFLLALFWWAELGHLSEETFGSNHILDSIPLHGNLVTCQGRDQHVIPYLMGRGYLGCTATPVIAASWSESSAIAVPLRRSQASRWPCEQPETAAWSPGSRTSELMPPLLPSNVAVHLLRHRHASDQQPLKPVLGMMVGLHAFHLPHKSRILKSCPHRHC